MLGHGPRDARRTSRYLDGLMAADERRAAETPADTDLDPAIRFAAGELRAGLVRVHPSFRFEESLSARLAAGAARLRAGLPIETVAVTGPGTVSPFRGRSAIGAASSAVASAVALAGPEVAGTTPGADPANVSGTQSRALWPADALRRFPEMAARPSRPLIVGGVGVASAAISIGAVYVAWRHSHPAPGLMGRAARAAHDRTGHSGHGRRSGVINGILGVVS
jgi:hypothetical protein